MKLLSFRIIPALTLGLTLTLTLLGLMTYLNAKAALAAAPFLSISKSAPVTAMPDDLITYTLAVTNSGDLTAANLVITDAIPAGATYVSGGTQANGVVSWTLLALPPGLSTTVQFVVTATDSLVNRAYGVTAEGGYSAAGEVPVVTLLPQGCEAYPLALQESRVAGLQPGDVIGPLDYGWFGWVSWNPWNIGLPNSEMTLLRELQNPALSLTDFTDFINFTDQSLSIGDSVRRNSGTIGSNDYYAELDRLMASGITMRVVVWDYYGGTGLNSYYQVADFILVEITGFTQSPYPLRTLTLTYLGPVEDPETCRSLGVELAPASPQSGSPGQVLTYTHRLTNLGRFTETALLTYTTRPTGWPVAVTPYSQTLGPGQAVTVTALVTVPLDSPDGLTHLTTLTAALAVSPAVSAAVTDTTSVLNGPRLSLGKSGPITATAGSPITYTLTVTNSGNLTAANLVITDAIPAGATYVSGGMKVGNIVSWTLPSLAANGGVTHTSFVVTATQMITNSDYGVQADGGYRGQGNEAVVTVVGEVTTEQSVFLPVILKK